MQKKIVSTRTTTCDSAFEHGRAARNPRSRKLRYSEELETFSSRSRECKLRSSAGDSKCVSNWSVADARMNENKTHIFEEKTDKYLFYNL